MLKDQLDSNIAAANDIVEPITGCLDQWAANGRSEMLRKQMLEDTFILKDLAIYGQWTVFYAETGTGKTLLTLWLLRESLNEGLIDGSNIYYVNCDDNFRGSVEKLEIAEKCGFNMLIPNQNGFMPDQLVMLMREMAISGDAHGKAIVFDTLKKFTNIMDKKQSTEFGKIARSFTSAGGSLVCLAHTNKNKGEDGKSVYSGTNDILSDADCGYIIENKGIQAGGEETKSIVEFENIKQRGDTASKMSFSFIKEGKGYNSLLDSVERISPDASIKINKHIQSELQREKDDTIINAACQLIHSGNHTKTELTKLIIEETGESRRKIINALGRWNGIIWLVEKKDNNALIFKIKPNEDGIYP